MLRFDKYLFIVIVIMTLLLKLTSACAVEYTPHWYNRADRPPIYESPEKDFRFYLGGFFQEDVMDVRDAPPLRGIANTRAARLETAMDWRKKWVFSFSYDFTNQQLFNAFTGYDNLEDFLFLVGQFSPVFGLVNSDDTPYITFLELPLPVNLFSPAFLPGAEFGFYKNPFVVYGSLFGPTLGSTVHGSLPYGETVNVVYSPIHEERRMFHLGFSAWNQTTDSWHVLSLGTVPELFAPNQGNIIDAGPINNVVNYQVIDAAIAGLYGPLTIESEYIESWVKRNQNLSTLAFGGYYAIVSYFLTGESRVYSFKNAGFIGITPIRHRFGAWQFAIQFSRLNLTEQDILGGRESNVTVGLNWFPTQPIEFMLMYIHAMANPNADGINQQSNLYALRIQAVF